MRVMAGNRPARSVSGRLNRNCEFLFGTRRPPARLGRPSVTIRFNGNSAAAAAARGAEAREARAAELQALNSGPGGPPAIASAMSRPHM